MQTVLSRKVLQQKVRSTEWARVGIIYGMENGKILNLYDVCRPLKLPTFFFLRILFFSIISPNIKSGFTSINYFIPFDEFLNLL